MKKNEKGFTLSELLIVVAIVVVLVIIAIPVFSGQLHKSRVATDMANVRSYYSQLQYDFLENGYDETVVNAKPYGSTEFELGGQTIKLEEGVFGVAPEYDDNVKRGKIIGYNVLYSCNKGDCTLMLPQD